MYVKILLYVLLIGWALPAHAQYAHRQTKLRPPPPLPPLSFKTMQDEPFRSTDLTKFSAKDSVSVRWRPDTLKYPGVALRKGVEGVLVVRVLFAPDGHVEDLAFERLDPVRVDIKQDRVVVVVTGRGAGFEQLRNEGVRALAENSIAYFRQVRIAPRSTPCIIRMTSKFTIR